MEIEVEGGRARYLVHLTMNAIFSVVRSSAAMIRSPSFSRSVESRTMMNSPRPDPDVRQLHHMSPAKKRTCPPQRKTQQIWAREGNTYEKPLPFLVST